MTADAVPPPLPTPRPTRPPVPVTAVLVAAFSGFAILGSACFGGAALSLARRAERRVAASSARRAEHAKDRERIADAKASLDAVAARLEATSRGQGELPETLAEAPPNDPWGRPIEYLRLEPTRAVLRSAGPDGKFGTKDDVRREVEGK